MIRLATPHDAEAVHAIYAPIVRETPISFEYDVPTVADMEARIQSVLQKRPWLVYERAGEVLGYVYATTFRDRLAYQWGAEVSVYVRPDAQRRGIARGLYTALFDILRLQGYFTAVAGATLPNPGTEKLHEAMGFQLLGVYPRAGYKFNRWHDVIFWYLHLQHPPNEPHEPLRLKFVLDSDEWHTAVARGAALIKEV